MCCLLQATRACQRPLLSQASTNLLDQMETYHHNTLPYSITDKWQGIFYFPRHIEKVRYTKAFNCPVVEHCGQCGQLSGSRIGPVPRFPSPSWDLLHHRDPLRGTIETAGTYGYPFLEVPEMMEYLWNASCP